MYSCNIHGYSFISINIFYNWPIMFPVTLWLCGLQLAFSHCPVNTLYCMQTKQESQPLPGLLEDVKNSHWRTLEDVKNSQIMWRMVEIGVPLFSGKRPSLEFSSLECPWRDSLWNETFKSCLYLQIVNLAQSEHSRVSQAFLRVLKASPYFQGRGLVLNSRWWVCCRRDSL